MGVISESHSEPVRPQTLVEKALRPAEDDGIFGAHGTSSSLPVVLRLSMSAWAFAASASRYSPPIRTLTFPFAIQSNNCAERARNISGVWIWSRNTAKPILMLFGSFVMLSGPGPPRTGPYQQNVPDRRSTSSDP